MRLPPWPAPAGRAPWASCVRRSVRPAPPEVARGCSQMMLLQPLLPAAAAAASRERAPGRGSARGGAGLSLRPPPGPREGLEPRPATPTPAAMGQGTCDPAALLPS